MQTIAPAAFDALLATVTAAVAPVAAVEGELGTRVEQEYVQITDVDNAKDWAGMGAGGQSPQADIVLITGVIWTYTGSDGATGDMRRRAYTLLGLIETAIAGDVTLGLPRVSSSLVSGSHLKQGPTDQGGRAAQLTFTVTVHAYLSR